jgi:hypothetical protein
VLLILGGQALRFPHRFLVLFAVVLVAALLLPRTRSALREALPESIPLGIVLVLLAAVPFFAVGYVGVLGASISNDMSTHLLGAWYLRTGEGFKPVAAIGGNIIDTGYPMGPHGLTTALTKAFGVGEETAFAAVTMAVPVLTAFAALGVVPTARRGVRWLVAVAIGFGYLPIAYFAQGSFKETIQAMLVLGGALALGELFRADEPPRAWRRGIPLGLFAGAAVYNYSYGGAAWLVAAAGLLLVAEFARRPRAFVAFVKTIALPAVAAIAVAVVVAVPEIHRIQNFRHSIFGVEPKRNTGNLYHAINPLESLGVWLSGDFRINPHPMWPSVALSVLALVVLLGSFVWWWRRREFALPAAAIAAFVIWVEFAINRNIYNAAKGFVVLAPLVAACIAGPLALAWSARRAGRDTTLLRATGVVLLVAAFASSYAVLRTVPVGLGQHEKELASLRPLVKDKRVGFISNDHFAQWEVRGSDLYASGLLYAPKQLVQQPQKLGGATLDADNYASPELDKLQYIVTPGGRYASEIPPNFRLVRRTESFDLYHRVGRTPSREPLEPPGEPGAIFDCNSPRGKEYLKTYKWAGVLPAPVVTDRWDGSIAVPGDTARTAVTLPRGRWDVSLQYVSRTPIEVRAPGLRKTIAPSFGTVVSYWPAGTVTSPGGRVTLTLTAEKRSWFGRLIGGPRPMLAPGVPGEKPLWHVAFTRHGTTPQRIPSKQACGRYVDWFAPAGGVMKGRSLARDNAVRAS